MHQSDLDTLRAAANLISGQFEHTTTPPAVTEVLNRLDAMARADKPAQGTSAEVADRMKFEKWFFTGGVKFDKLNTLGIAQAAWQASTASRSAEKK